MKTKIIYCFFCLLVFLPVAAQEKPSSKADAFFKKAMSEINPQHIVFIKSTAKTVQEKNLSEADTRNMATRYGSSLNFNNADIEALCFLILMEARKNSEEDLKSILADIKTNNDQKKQIRHLQQDFEKNKKDVSRSRLDSIKLVLKNQPVAQTANKGKVMRPVKNTPVNNTARQNQLTPVSRTVTKEEIDNTGQVIKNKMDTISEMGETESLRLQMAMDRRSKMMSIISNIFKKLQDTEDQIIQNMK